MTTQLTSARRIGWGLLLAGACLWSLVWPPFVAGSWVFPGWVTTGVAVTAASLAALRWKLLRPLVVLCALLALGASAFVGLTSSSFVLRPSGPAGCRVVVVESAFMMSGNGSVGTIDRPVGFARMQSSYDADDGGRPFSSGDYSLTWSERDPVLRASGPLDAKIVRQDFALLHC